MSKIYSPRIVQDGLVMCLDASQNKSYPTTDLPVKNGLLLWLDASDDTTFNYSSGTEISQWRDKSGNNFHANQSNVSQQPSRSNVVNSRKTVNFVSSSGDFMRVSSGIVTPNYITIFAVVKPGTQGNDYAVILEQDHGNGYNGWVIQRNANTSNWQTWVASAASTWLNANAVAYTSGTTQIVTLRKNFSTLNLYSNGTTNGAVGISDTVITQTSYGLNLGYWQYGNGRYYSGEICEIAVFNRGLSDVELKQVNTYLGQKWGILNTDRSIVDLSGNNDNGLLGNGTVANIPAYDFYNKGTLRFDGANDYVFLSNSQLNISSTITVEAWVKYNAQGGYNARSYSVITCKGYPWTWLLEDQSGQFNFRISTSVTADSNANSSYSHGLNTWNHVVGTYDGTSQKIYVDGVLRSTVSLTGTINTSSNDALVGCYNYGDYCLTGNVGVVRVYNKTLSAAEIFQNYESQKSRFVNTIVQQGLVLNLDAGNPYSYAGAGTTWYDVSGIGNNGTLTNGPTYSRTNDGYIVFDGTDDYVSIPSNNNFNNGNNITVEAWVLCTNWSSYTHPMIVAKGINVEWILWKSNDVGYVGKLGWRGAGTAYTTTSLPNNTWVQCVGSIGSAGQKVYLNGVLESTVGNTTFTSGNVNVTIAAGLVTGSPANLLGANVAITRIYNTQLTDAQVLQNYNATKGRFGL